MPCSFPAIHPRQLHMVLPDGYVAVQHPFWGDVSPLLPARQRLFSGARPPQRSSGPVISFCTVSIDVLPLSSRRLRQPLLPGSCVSGRGLLCRLALVAEV